MKSLELAEKYGWTPIEYNGENKRIRFKKGLDYLLDYWYTKDTVGTIITHWRNGRKQLFRKNVGRTLEELFRNPRSHTGEGYYKK